MPESFFEGLILSSLCGRPAYGSKLDDACPPTYRTTKSRRRAELTTSTSGLTKRRLRQKALVHSEDRGLSTEARQYERRSTAVNEQQASVNIANYPALKLHGTLKTSKRGRCLYEGRRLESQTPETGEDMLRRVCLNSLSTSSGTCPCWSPTTSLVPMCSSHAVSENTSAPAVPRKGCWPLTVRITVGLLRASRRPAREGVRGSPNDSK